MSMVSPFFSASPFHYYRYLLLNIMYKVPGINNRLDMQTPDKQMLKFRSHNVPQ